MRCRNQSLTSTIVPLVITPNDVYIGELGFFFTPMIGKQKVALSSGCVTCALLKRSACRVTTMWIKKKSTKDSPKSNAAHSNYTVQSALDEWCFRYESYDQKRSFKCCTCSCIKENLISEKSQKSKLISCNGTRKCWPTDSGFQDVPLNHTSWFQS